MDSELTLKTDRLVLRPITVEDVDVVYPYMNDPEISRYMSWNAHSNRDETHAVLERLEAETRSGKAYTWAIVRASEFCGIISLISILRTHRALTYDRAELAYWLGREFRGQGIMTEAASRVIDFAFNRLGLHRLTVSHVTENAASESLITRLNFTYIGEEREAFQKAGKWFHHKLYDLLATDVRGRGPAGSQG